MKKTTQTQVAIKVAQLIKVKKDLIKVGLTTNAAGVISSVLIRCSTTILPKVLEVINQLKPN